MPIYPKDAAQQIVQPKDQPVDASGYFDHIGDVVKRTITGEEFRPQEGDDQKFGMSGRNMLIGALGLPDNWKQSDADYKQFARDLPMNAGMAAMGSISKVGPTAEAALGSALPSMFGKAATVEERAASEMQPELAGILQRGAQEHGADAVKNAVKNFDTDKMAEMFGKRNTQKLLDWLRNR